MNQRTRLKRRLARTRREHFPQRWCVDTDGRTVDLKAERRANRNAHRRQRRYWAFRVWLARKPLRDAERGAYGIHILSAQSIFQEME